MQIARRTAAALATATALLAPAAPATATAASECDRVVAAGGSVQALADSLAPGQTGCLRAGTYVGAVKVSRPDVRLTVYPGEAATIQGRIWVAGDGVVIEGLTLNGRNPTNLPSPSVTGDNTVFRHNDVTNDHTTICFSLGHPAYGRAVNTLIQQNRIHHCGELPATNHHHGIYITAADDTRILGNWIYQNADRGIQVYPDAQRTVIRGNVIDGNGQGIIFGGEGSVTSSDSVVQGNLITGSTIRDNVESWYPAGTPIGQNNLVTGNCIAGGARDNGDGGIAQQVGFTATANSLVRPDYASRAEFDYRVSPINVCHAILADHSVPGVNHESDPEPAPAADVPTPSGNEPAEDIVPAEDAAPVQDVVPAEPAASVEDATSVEGTAPAARQPERDGADRRRSVVKRRALARKRRTARRARIRAKRMRAARIRRMAARARRG